MVETNIVTIRPDNPNCINLMLTGEKAGFIPLDPENSVLPVATVDRNGMIVLDSDNCLNMGTIIEVGDDYTMISNSKNQHRSYKLSTHPISDELALNYLRARVDTGFVLPKKGEYGVRLLREHAALREASSHANVRTAYGLHMLPVVDPDHNKTYYYPVLDLEHVEGTTVDEVFKRPADYNSLIKNSQGLHGIAATLEMFHSKRIALRDLEPSHLIERKGKAYEGQFILNSVGRSSFNNKTRRVSDWTFPYADPEQAVKHYGDWNDIFSFGAMWVEQLTGEPPFPERMDVSAIAEGKMLSNSLAPDIHEKIVERYPELYFATETIVNALKIAVINPYYKRWHNPRILSKCLVDLIADPNDSDSLASRFVEYATLVRTSRDKEMKAKASELMVNFIANRMDEARLFYADVMVTGDIKNLNNRTVAYNIMRSLESGPDDIWLTTPFLNSPIKKEPKN